MGGYQLSLQGGAYNPAARLDYRKSGSSDGSSRRSSRTVESPSGYGGKRQSNLEGLVHPSPPRHSTACCDGLSLRRELSSQRIKAAADAVESRGHSFRSDDSDSLALWEEMDSMSSSSSAVASVAPSERDGWVKLSTQSPRWLDAMAKLAPWRSSPVHPRSGDTPRASLDRKSSTRSLQDSRKGWYTKRSRSMWSPKVAANSSKWDQASSKGDQSSEEGSKHSSFSGMIDEDTRYTASAVTWDISAGREPTVKNSTRPVSGLSWEIPIVDTKITDDLLPDSARESSASEEAQFDGHSEYASCRTFVEDELLSPGASIDEEKSANELGYVNVIDFVAPLLSKLQSIEKEGPRTERRVSFKWEAGPKIRGEEVAPTTETPKPPGDPAAYETLRQQYLLKSQSAPLDGLYMFMSESNSALPWEKKPAGEGALRRVNSSPDPRMFRTAPGPSPLGIDSKSDPESPRSILRGPDDGSSVPSSSNPSRRSEGPQSMSSCSESFDDYELIGSTAYNLNSACIIVESRRVSLSFRDFGPAQPADMAEARESSNVELLGCDRDQLSANALRASPELWTATFSARYTHDADEPTASPQPMRQLAYLMSCEDEQEQEQEQEQQRPVEEMKRTRSRNGEFTARLGVMFSPLRLISSHESSNHGCFVAATVSPPHDDGEEPHTIVKILSPSLGFQSTQHKSKGYWSGAHSRSSKRRHSSDDHQTMMVSFSKAMKKILSKCTVKRSTSKGKSKTDSPALEALPPPEFHFT